MVGAVDVRRVEALQMLKRSSLSYPEEERFMLLNKLMSISVWRVGSLSMLKRSSLSYPSELGSVFLNKSMSVSVWCVEPCKMLKRSSSVASEFDVKEGLFTELSELARPYAAWLMVLECSCAVARIGERGRRGNSPDFNSPELFGDGSGGEDIGVLEFSRLVLIGTPKEISNSSIWSS